MIVGQAPSAILKRTTMKPVIKPINIPSRISFNRKPYQCLKVFTVLFFEGSTIICRRVLCRKSIYNIFIKLSKKEIHVK